MKQNNATQDDFFDGDIDLNNIIKINSVTENIDELQDFDFDYDPNEMFFALQEKS